MFSLEVILGDVRASQEMQPISTLTEDPFTSTELISRSPVSNLCWMKGRDRLGQVGNVHDLANIVFLDFEIVSSGSEQNPFFEIDRPVKGDVFTSDLQIIGLRGLIHRVHGHVTFQRTVYYIDYSSNLSTPGLIHTRSLNPSDFRTSVSQCRATGWLL